MPGESPFSATNPPPCSSHGASWAACAPRWLALGLILLAAFGWRFAGLTRSEVWRDEAMTIIHTRAPLGQLLTRLPFVEDSPPAGFLLFKVWSLGGHSEVWMRLLPVLLGVAAVGVLMAIARRVRPGAEWATGLLAAFSYELLYYSQEVRVYALLVLATTLCLWAAERSAAPAGAGRSPLWCALFAVLAAHCHAVGLFVLPMCIVYRVVRTGLDRRAAGAWLPAVAVWLVLCAPVIWFGMYWSRQHAADGNWWAGGLDLLSARVLLERFLFLARIRQWSAYGEWGASMWRGFVLERVLMLAAAGLLGLGLLGRDRRAVLACLAAGGTYTLLMLVSSLVALPNVSERTMLPAWVPLVLVLGIGASDLGTRRRRMIGMGSLAALTLIWAAAWLWTTYAAPPRRSLSREAMAWLKARVQPADLVVSGPYGYEDILVYHLEDAIAGEQLVSEGIPVYSGRPPTHAMIYRRPDPAWGDHLRKRLRATAPSASVWMVRLGWTNGQVEGILAESRTPTDRFGSTEIASTTVTRYIANPASSPSGATPPGAQ